MNRKAASPNDGRETPRSAHGARTAVEGTPHPVDFSRDRRARVAWAVLLAGPVIWFAHFMLVYLVVEAGCSGGGAGFRLLRPPVPTLVTLGATLIAAVATLGSAGWAFARWRGGGMNAPAGTDDSLQAEDYAGDKGVAFGGFLLSILAFVTILFVGLPALFLPAC